MLQIYEKKAKDTSINKLIIITQPENEEINKIQKEYNIEEDFLKAALDPEEVSRLEIENDQTLILLNAPIEKPNNNNHLNYTTMPVGIILAKNIVIIISLRELSSIKNFEKKHLKNKLLYQQNEYILQLIYEIAVQFLREIRRIDKITDEIEKNLYRKPQKDYIVHLLTLEKNLVYFSTALRTNEQVLRKLIRTKSINISEEEEDLVEDTFIEIAQAQEMATIKRKIIISIRDATASIISNNLNDVMRILASFTIILTVPTMIFSFFGMNTSFGMLETNIYSTLLILLISLIISYILYKIMKKKDML